MRNSAVIPEKTVFNKWAVSLRGEGEVALPEIHIHHRKHRFASELDLEFNSLWPCQSKSLYYNVMNHLSVVENKSFLG